MFSVWGEQEAVISLWSPLCSDQLDRPISEQNEGGLNQIEFWLKMSSSYLSDSASGISQNPNAEYPSIAHGLFLPTFFIVCLPIWRVTVTNKKIKFSLGDMLGLIFDQPLPNDSASGLNIKAIFKIQNGLASLSVRCHLHMLLNKVLMRC